MRMNLALAGTLLGLSTFSNAAVAQSGPLVELRIEELFRSSWVTVPSGQAVTVVTSLGESRTLWVTPTVVADDRLSLTIVDLARPSAPLADLNIGISEPVAVTVGGTSLKIAVVAVESSVMVSSALSYTMKHKSPPPTFGLYDLCCLTVDGGRRCGCRVIVGSTCCAADPCSCGGGPIK